MLGRQVTAALRRPLQARLRSITVPPTQSSLCIRTFSYAPFLLNPAGRPKKAVGEPSRPVKRAVKAKAKEPASTETDAAAKKIAAKEKAAKKKIAEKEKAAKKKAAAAKKAKPALTPEKIERQKAALQKAEITDLKKAALEPPAVNGRRSAYLLFSKEKGNELRERIANESDSEGKASPATVRTQLTEHTRRVAAAWKNVTPSEIEHYNHLVHTANEAAAAEYKRWVESHDVSEIRIANLARARLRRRLDPKSAKKWPIIKDERQVKRATTSFVQFSISRQASGDFKHIAVSERAKLLSQEWKALSDEEKQKYKNLTARDQERASSEESSVYSSA